jgi:hypothetical protein
LAGAQVRLIFANSGIPRPHGTVKTDAAGRFVIEDVFPRLPFSLHFQKGGHYRDIGAKYQKLTVTPSETRDLGDIPSKTDAMD